jgi:ribosome-binding protein aMBF1 (putative translation factor)
VARRGRKRRVKSAEGEFMAFMAFTQLSSAEAEIEFLRRDLADALRRRREKSRMTQASLAKRLRSSQSRVARMESAHVSVSIALQIKALFALGATRNDLADAIAPDDDA